jgi:hypothetical protein
MSKQGKERKRQAPHIRASKLAAALQTPVLCEGCGDALEEDQWAVQFPHSGKCCHLSCWEDPLSPRVAAKLAALKTGEKVLARVMLTVPADDLDAELETVPSFEVVELGKNLKKARRELRHALEEGGKLRDEVSELKSNLANARASRDRESALYISACTERRVAEEECEAALEEVGKLRGEVRDLKVTLANARAELNREGALFDFACAERNVSNEKCDAVLKERDAALAECNSLKTLKEGLQQTIKELRVEVSARAEQTRVLMGRTVDTLNEDQRNNLRADLEAALKRVDTWQAAEEAVGKQRPELCCPLSLHERLMHDPVMTLDGRTYERLAINKHFEMLVRSKQPIMSPQKDLLASALVVSNVTLKKHIVAMVQEKAEELAAGGAAKRRRGD